MIAGLGAVAGGGAALLHAGQASAGAPPVLAAAPETNVLSAPNAALTYLSLDAMAFDVFEQSDVRLYQALTGMGLQTAPGWIGANLPLAVGSVVRQINVAFQGQPILFIRKRPLTAPNPPEDTILGSLAVGGGPKTQTLDLTTPITIEAGASYSLVAFISSGDSVYGMTVGHTPPAQSFVPFTGTPRVLDTRTAGGKLAPGEERTVALGFVGARSAVVNLTVTDTEGASGGFVAMFPADVAWPGNSSINWSGPDQNVANGVIVALDAAGAVKIRGGAARTNVVIDRIGFMI